MMASDENMRRMGLEERRGRAERPSVTGQERLDSMIPLKKVSGPARFVIPLFRR